MKASHVAQDGLPAGPKRLIKVADAAGFYTVATLGSSAELGSSSIVVRGWRRSANGSYPDLFCVGYSSSSLEVCPKPDEGSAASPKWSIDFCYWWARERDVLIKGWAKVQTETKLNGWSVLISSKLVPNPEADEIVRVVSPRPQPVKVTITELIGWEKSKTREARAGLLTRQVGVQ